MKPWMRPYVFAFGLIAGCLLLFSLISSSLYALSLIDAFTYHLLNTVLPYLAFALSGLIFGLLIEKKALLQALFMVTVLTLCALLLQENTGWLHLCAHSALWLLCALLTRLFVKR